MGEEDFKPLKADDMREVITKLPGADVPPEEKEEVKDYVQKKARKFGVETQDYKPQEIAKDDEYTDAESYDDEASDSTAKPEPKVNPTPSNQEPVSNEATSKGQTAADKTKRDSMKEVPKVSRGVQPTKPKQQPIARKVFETDMVALAEQKAKEKEIKAKRKELKANPVAIPKAEPKEQVEAVPEKAPEEKPEAAPEEKPKETVKPQRVKGAGKKPEEDKPVEETEKPDLGKKPLTEEEIAEAGKKRKEGLKPFKPEHKPFKAEEKIGESVEESKATDEEKAERAEKKAEREKSVQEATRRQKAKADITEGLKATFDDGPDGKEKRTNAKAIEKNKATIEKKVADGKFTQKWYDNIRRKAAYGKSNQAVSEAFLRDLDAKAKELKLKTADEVKADTEGRGKASPGFQNMNPRSPSSSKLAAPPETEQAKRFKEKAEKEKAAEKAPIEAEIEETSATLKELKQTIKDMEAIVKKLPENKVYANELEAAKQEFDVREAKILERKEALAAIDKKWADKYADVANAMGPTTVERAKQDMFVDADGKVIGSGRVPVKEAEVGGFKTRSEEEAEEKSEAETAKEEPTKPGNFVTEDFLDKPNHYAGNTVKNILRENPDRSKWVTGQPGNQRLKPNISQAAGLVMSNMNVKTKDEEGEDAYTTLGAVFENDFGGKVGQLYSYRVDAMGKKSGKTKVLTAHTPESFRIELLTKLVNGTLPVNEVDGKDGKDNMVVYDFKLSEGSAGQEASKDKMESGEAGDYVAQKYEDRKNAVEIEDKELEVRDTPKGFRDRLVNMTKKVGGNLDGTDRQTIASIVGAVAKGAYQEAESTLVEFLNAKGLMHGNKVEKIVDSNPELKALFKFVSKMPHIEGEADKVLAREDAEDSHKARAEREAKGQAQAFGANVLVPLYMKSLIEESPEELEALKLGKPDIYSSLMRQVDKAEAKVKREYETFKSKGMIDAQTASEIDKMPEGEEKRDAIVTALIDGVNEWLGGRVRTDPKGLDLDHIRDKAQGIAGGKLANVESFFNEKGELQMPELLVAGAKQAHRRAKVGYAPKVDMVRGQMTDPAKGIRETREETDEREAEDKEKEVKSKQKTDEALQAGKYSKQSANQTALQEKARAKADKILEGYDGPIPVGRKDPEANKDFVRNMVMAYLMRGEDPKAIGDYLKEMAEHHGEVKTADVVDQGGYVDIEEEVKTNSLDTTGIKVVDQRGQKPKNSKKDKSVDWSGKGNNQIGPYDESTKKMIAAKKKAGTEKAEKKGLKKSLDELRKWVKPRRWA